MMGSSFAYGDDRHEGGRNFSLESLTNILNLKRIYTEYENSGPLYKVNKKRKKDLCSLVMTSGSRMLKRRGPLYRNRKGESNRKKLIHKRHTHKGHLRNSSSDQFLCSNSKNKRESRGLQTHSLKKMTKHKRKKEKVVVDEASQLQRRARYLLVKLKLEQNLIDAYSGEGWKGQSREKVKPEKELQRARKQILKCKLGIRDTVYKLDLLGSVGQIDNSLIAPDGSVHHEHIFCKECKSQEVSEDNDIILCDGTCNCAFHQKCIDPPLATEDIPPEDEGWLCKYCDCKMEIIEAMNAHLGTQFSDSCTWQDIFGEEALSDIGSQHFNPEEEWPGDESDDNDYVPDGDENSSHNRCSMEDSGSHEESSTSSLCCSLESEVYSESGLSAERNGMSNNISPLHPTFDIDSNDHEIVSGPRQRSSVDYRKLYDEMFGKDTANDDSFSEDEDWDPPTRRRREKECDAASTLMTLFGCEVKNPYLHILEVGNNHLPTSRAKKPLSRIPSDALQKLRQAFSENELPSTAVKKKISELVGLEYEKVNKWFKNARYMALKNRKQRERASHSSPTKRSDSEADIRAEVNFSKCLSPPTSTHKRKRLLKVSWNTKLMTLISPSKRHRVKKTSLCNAKANVELSDDMSFRKQLLYLKPKSRQKKRTCETERFQVQRAEVEMEHLCRMEAKVWKLMQILSTIQKTKENGSNDQHVVYIPIAELKEKL